MYMKYYLIFFRIEVRKFFNLDTKIKEPERPNLFKCSGTINLGPSERPS